MTENISPSSKPPNPEIIEEIAIELGVDPSFVEKDWYAVQVLKIIKDYNHEQIEAIFSGGTNLSKAYGIIERFSEDIDLRAQFDEIPTGGERKKFRDGLIKAVNTSPHLKVIKDSVKTRDSRRFFSFDIEYPQTFETAGSLRPHLKLEFKLRKPQTEPETKPIRSFVNQFTNAKPETDIACISPLEIAADKLSALTWRILNNERNSETYDPTIMRHLHDLSALLTIIKENPGIFKTLAGSSFNDDHQQSRHDITHSLQESSERTLQTLKDDPSFEQDYQNFVAAMSYATEDTSIGFSQAIEAFQEIIDLFK